MKFEQIIQLRFGIKDIKKAADNGVNDDISNERAKQPEFDFKSYSWDQCISDNEPKYGAKGAAKVCGAIKNMTEQMEAEEMKDMKPNPCWKGYEPVGLKPDGSPNCVPMKASTEEFVIPQPESGEDKQHYVSRCVKALSKEDKPQAQILAICYAQIEK